MGQITLFSAGDELKKQFPESMLIRHKDLGTKTMDLVSYFPWEGGLVGVGSVAYPTLTAAMGIPHTAPLPIFICASFHSLSLANVQNNLLRRLKKGKICKSISWEEAKQKYSHLVVDRQGNILLVKETRKGALKRFFTNFYLAKTRIREPKEKSRFYRALRKAQRKLWPDRKSKRIIGK